MATPLALLASPLLGLAGKLIDKLFTTPEEKAAAQLRVLELEQSGQLKELEISMSAIVAEAQSDDKWTSRARPGLLYVCYILILAALPMGVLYAFTPETAGMISEGFKTWLAAIPEPIITLMGIGYLGYAGARSWDKRTQVQGIQQLR